MNIYKRFAIASVVLSFVFLGCLLSLLYVYDPLQLYHKPYFREVAFSDDMRVQDKGIIKNYDFDSFILGTSMLANTSAKEADEKIGGKWVNISMKGSSFNERTVILQYIFKQKPKTQYILTSLDITQLLAPEIKDTSNFDFLYDNNVFNDMKIYINQKYILCALRFASSSGCVGYKDIELLTNWAKQSDKIGGFHKWLESKSHNAAAENAIEKLKNEADKYIHFETKPLSKSIEASQNMIEDYLISFIKQHPQTQFKLIIPPYSRLWYRLDDSQSLTEIQTILKWLVSQTKSLPNAKIYGFDDLNYTDNIANYDDTTHYNVDMNSMQLDAIASDTHILTPENIDEYLQTMENKIKAYDLVPLIQEIKDYEVRQKQ